MTRYIVKRTFFDPEEGCKTCEAAPKGRLGMVEQWGVFSVGKLPLAARGRTIMTTHGCWVIYGSHSWLRAQRLRLGLVIKQLACDAPWFVADSWDRFQFWLRFRKMLKQRSEAR